MTVYIFNRQWLRPVLVHGVWIGPRQVTPIDIGECAWLLLPPKAEYLGVSEVEDKS